MKKKVAFHTLGCKLNYAETSTISRLFSEDQFERVPANSKADIYVINTCSVTDSADKKCRQAIKKFINLSPEALIVAVGCYAQLQPQILSSIKGVDLVLGTKDKFDVVDYITGIERKDNTEVHSCDTSSITSFNPSYSIGNRTRSFLKVQDGCDYWCSYCTIPLARGRSRNPDIASIIDEAVKIAEKGVKEIVITGVNIGDFGKSTKDSFIDLLKELVKIDGIERFRISSIEPNLLTKEIIEMAVTNKKILPHFHIPLQSGNNKILGLMKRRYTRDVFKDRVNLIRKKLPFAGIGADVIVGFPGESNADFEDCYCFLEEMSLSYLHVFSFSARPFTAAEKLPDRVSLSEIKSRSKKLSSLSNNKSLDFYNLNAGRTENVLFERTQNDGIISGFTSNYIRVEHPWQSKLAGQIKKVKLNSISDTGKMSITLID